MWISELRFSHFRNYTDRHFRFNCDFNLIVGPNGIGKTNILEGIYLIGRGRSFRTSHHAELIECGEAKGDVQIVLHLSLGKLTVGAELNALKKIFWREEKRSRVEKLGLTAVVFAPEEILLITAEPGARRHYLDYFIGALDPGFVSRHYQRVLSQRNRLLKEVDEIGEAGVCRGLDGWDSQLAELGAKVILARAAWMARLNPFLSSAYREIAGEEETASWEYAPYGGKELVARGEMAIRDYLQGKLMERRADELIRRVTLVGPHRDDIAAMIGTRPAALFGSQGERRSFILAAKLAEISVIESVTHEWPVLLLDDVASELDHQRNRAFFSYLAAYRGQVFATATEENLVHLPKPAEPLRIGALDQRT